MVYFDNSASTKPLEEVVAKAAEVALQNFANPSSASRLGVECDNIMRQSAKTLAKYINADPEEIYFTSGGTEGDAWAVLGAAKGYARSGKHIITTATEHSAVSKPMEELKADGFEITVLGVDENGRVNIDELKNAVRTDTTLVSIIAVNNETGAIQPLEQIGAAIKRANPKTLFHTDAVQAFGKIDIDVKKANIDLLTMSGHKINGLKGTGFNYMKKGLKVKPLIVGGGQQKGNRGGTENVAGAISLALAAQGCFKDARQNAEKVAEVKKTLVEGVLSEIENAYLNASEGASPYVANISFMGVRSEALLHALEEKDIFVSAGSACDSRKKSKSSVLSAMGLEDERIDGAIRFSFSRFNEKEEARLCVEALKEIVPMLRRTQSVKRNERRKR